MKTAFLIAFITIIAFLGSCKITKSKEVTNESIQGIWMGCYMQNPKDTAWEKFFKNPSPIELLLDISTEKITFLKYESYEFFGAYQESYNYHLIENLLLVETDSVIDTLNIIKKAGDSLVIQNTMMGESYAVFRKSIPNNKQVPNFKPKLYQLTIPEFTDTLEIIDDSTILPINALGLYKYTWQKYKGIPFLNLYGTSDLGTYFLDSVQDGVIYLKTFYNSNSKAQLREVVNYKKKNIDDLYGYWIEEEVLIDNGNTQLSPPPPPPLPLGLVRDDLIRKLHITKDSLCFTHMGGDRNRKWYPNLTNQYIHFTKPLLRNSNWKINFLSSDSLIIETNEYRRSYLYLKSKQ